MRTFESLEQRNLIAGLDLSNDGVLDINDADFYCAEIYGGLPGMYPLDMKFDEYLEAIGTVRGDLTFDGVVDEKDAAYYAENDLFTTFTYGPAALGTYSTGNLNCDIPNEDVDDVDWAIINDQLDDTTIRAIAFDMLDGDVNRDHQFDSADLVAIFAGGDYQYIDTSVYVRLFAADLYVR